jgi:hypothetical protein
MGRLPAKLTPKMAERLSPFTLLKLRADSVMRREKSVPAEQVVPIHIIFAR